MAVKLENKVNVTAPSGTYPYGDIKDNTGSDNGTPVNRAVYGDFHQFFARILALGGVVANGLPENNANTWQYVTGLINMIVAQATTLVNAEAVTRGNADTTLQTNINNEASTRSGADVSLQSQIDGLTSGSVPNTRNLTAGDGIQGGGTLAADRTFNIDVSDFAGSGLEDDGSENLRIATGGVTETMLSGGIGNSKLAAGVAVANLGFTPVTNARTVTAGDGIQGGGALSGDITLNIDVSDFAGAGLEDDGSENLRLSAESGVSWTTSGLSLGSGVTNTSFRFKKTNRGTVKLDGWLTKSGGATGFTFATLPSGYWPLTTLCFPISAYGFLGGPGWVATIDTVGNIAIVESGGAGTLTGSNYSFDTKEFEV